MISPYVQYATHTIPELNYSYDSLSPYLSTEAVKVHHEIIHQSYVTNLNWVIKWTDMKNIPRDSSVKDMIVNSYNNPNLKALHNNSSPHWNHTLFWQCMKPNGGGSIPSELEAKIIEDFESIGKFKERFIKEGLSQLGSGWIWLVLNNDKLVIKKTNNISSPLIYEMKPLLGCDLWEHAYFMDYTNKRKDYLKSFLENLVNWEFVASQLN